MNPAIETRSPYNRDWHLGSIGSASPSLSNQTESITNTIDRLKAFGSQRDFFRAKAIEEQLYDTLASFKMKTAEVAMHLDSDWRAKLFRQLDGLLDVDEWEPADLPPTLASFLTFIRILLLIKPTRKPSIGASHDGVLVCTWVRDHNRLTLECLPGDQIRWSAGHDTPYGRDSGVGRTTLSGLRNAISPYSPDDLLNA